MFDMVLEGGKELDRKLFKLEKKTSKKIVRRGVREGLKPTHKAAKINARSTVGGEMGALIARNIVLRAGKQRPGSFIMKVRTKSEKEGAPKEFVHVTAEGHRYYVPYAIEYGHAFPGRGGEGRSGYKAPKDVAPAPFFRPAADANLKKAVPIFQRVVVEGIKQVMYGG
jgi:hypothetical protein